MTTQTTQQPDRAETHMLREIREQPDVVRAALAGAVEGVARVAAQLRTRGIDVIVLAARGTSDHAALFGQYLFQFLAGIPVALATPSLVTIYGAALRLDHALVIGISQSGQSTDIVEVVAKARLAGAYTVGITNFADSPLAQAAEQTLLCRAGIERSVAATKTYTTTCALLAALAAALPGGERLRGGVERLPDLIAAALDVEQTISRAVIRYVHARDCVVLGRGFQYSTARETALKLEETCYVITTPFSTADFRHGPAALTERGLPVILFAPPGRTSDEALELLRWLRERGADCVVVAQEDRLLELATTPVALRLPSLPGDGDRPAGGDAHAHGGEVTVDELLAPIPYIVPGQLFAQFLALGKGLDPDHPRSLSKVTQTR